MNTSGIIDLATELFWIAHLFTLVTIALYLAEQLLRDGIITFPEALLVIVLPWVISIVERQLRKR